MRAPSWWKQKEGIAFWLKPFGHAYYGLACLREYIATPYRASVPVLCVGNAVAGGAGKTPAVLWLAAWLKAKEYNVVIVSKGYGGHYKGPIEVDSTMHTATQVGDEPLLLARAAPTIVAKTRMSGIKAAEARGADIILMDDGMQNPTIYKHMNLLIVDGESCFGNGYLLPAGPLREPVAKALAKCDAVIQMGTALDSLSTEKPVFTARLRPQTSKKGKVVGFAGIGNPVKFHRTLIAAGYHVVAFHSFPDHHTYKEKDIKTMQREAKSMQAQLITTEKDAVRLPPSLTQNTGDAAIAVLPVTLNMDNAEGLQALLMNKLTLFRLPVNA